MWGELQRENSGQKHGGSPKLVFGVRRCSPTPKTLRVLRPLRWPRWTRSKVATELFGVCQNHLGAPFSHPRVMSWIETQFPGQENGGRGVITGAAC